MSEQQTLPEEVQGDIDAVMAALNSGTPLDQETRRRMRNRADKMREDLKRRHGELNIAVELVRQSRDEA